MYRLEIFGKKTTAVRNQQNLKRWLLGLWLLTGIGWAEDEAALDPKALEILKGFSEPLAAADRYSLHFSSQVEVTLHGRTDSMASSYRLSVDRPRRFLLEMTEGEKGVNLSSDGTDLTLHIPPLKRYLQMAAPDSLDDLFDREDFLALLGMVTMEGLELLPAFLHSRPGETLLKEVLTLKWQGEEVWEGQKVHRLRFTQEHFDWDILLSQGEPAAILYFEPDFTKVVKATREAMPQIEDFSIQASARYSAWTEEGTGVLYRVHLPEDVVKVESPADLFQMPERSEQEPTALQGEPAPDFSLRNLAGDTVRFSALKDYRVMILDFWATWCGPCVAALPPLASLAREYEDRGVRLFALNQGESADRIRSFLDSQKLSLEVLLDPDGQAGRAYHVQGIPQTVIIDEKGVVRKVHIGYVPDLKQQLAAEIDALLRE